MTRIHGLIKSSQVRLLSLSSSSTAIHVSSFSLKYLFLSQAVYLIKSNCHLCTTYYPWPSLFMKNYTRSNQLVLFIRHIAQTFSSKSWEKKHQQVNKTVCLLHVQEKWKQGWSTRVKYTLSIHSSMNKTKCWTKYILNHQMEPIGTCGGGFKNWTLDGGELLASPLFSSSSCTSSMAKEYWLWGGFMGCMGVGALGPLPPCWIRPWEHDILVTLPIQSSTGEWRAPIFNYLHNVREIMIVEGWNQQRSEWGWGHGRGSWAYMVTT